VALVRQLADGGARFCHGDRWQKISIQTAAASRRTVARVFVMEIDDRKYPFKLRPPAALEGHKPPTDFYSAGVHVTVRKP